ncbi:NADP oxidoreductase coenzyme F420-dependent [Desulfofarcimen acetoxidans DSM 771]|uniref:NADP oxidoreductase coenzyme F420-dependent n=1 Tax=Desulfofarcimen acetoxidans (strain ATCC 49208 / DSM 771 / KCTC 5769 / VKM B-1644 / 5575) TaxID=485916 RepID=C8W3T8_DESAS|nr:DUF2520 domain-containing protein [Desulfofarcimen acetoxidans]ACV61192.1 NADP oxidoreductase coenzyme F420-dependent [Desulfofarcimen acetoxidans DSM 771]
MQKPSIAIVGAGKVGTALAVLLKSKGYPVVGIASRTNQSARLAAARVLTDVAEKPEDIASKAEVVFITTPDRVIAEVDREIMQNGGYRPGTIVVHTSGSQPASILKSASGAGAYVVSIHPLQSFADVQVAIHNIPGSYIALDGDSEAMPVAEMIVSDLEGKKFIIAAKDKPLYHAAACIASNYLVSLLHFCTGLYEKFGLTRQQALEALYPLIQGTLNNTTQVGPVRALTGPISRGDTPTVESHLKAFTGCNALENDLYRKLGLYTVKVALEKGTINDEQAFELNQLLDM